MNKLLLSLFTFHFSLLASTAQSLTVEVKNPTADFRHEVVAIPTADVLPTFHIAGHDVPFRVLEGAALDVPYQLTHDGQLLIEAAVRPHGTARFVIVPGQPPKFQTVCHGALHPERKDDFAWENDRGAYRV